MLIKLTQYIPNRASATDLYMWVDLHAIVAVADLDVGAAGIMTEVYTSENPTAFLVKESAQEISRQVEAANKALDI
jgi:hypothetical protein